MRGKLDFQQPQLDVDNGLVIYLRNLASGHISIPARPINLYRLKTALGNVVE